MSAAEDRFTQALAAFKRAAQDLEVLWPPEVPDAVEGYPVYFPSFDEVTADLVGMEVDHAAFAREDARARADHAAYERGYRDAQQAIAHEAECQRVKQDAAAYCRGYNDSRNDCIRILKHNREV